MSDYMELHSEDGPLDVASITAYLDGLPFAFRDPRPGAEEASWLVCDSAASATLRRDRLQTSPRGYITAVFVAVTPDYVSSRHSCAHTHVVDQARAKQIVAWLLERGNYRAIVDGQPREAKLELLFPNPLPTPAELDAIPPSPHPIVFSTEIVPEGPATQMYVYPTGLVEFETRTSGMLTTRLSAEAHARWKAIVAELDLDPYIEDPPIDERHVGANFPIGDDVAPLSWNRDNPPAGYDDFQAYALELTQRLEGWSRGGDLPVEFVPASPVG